MICYFHPSETQPPAFLRGARDLTARATQKGGMIFGIGPSYLCGGNPDEGVDLADGWKCWVVGAIDSARLYREARGQPVIPIEDSQGRAWAVPLIRGPGGARMFQVSYAGGWRPVLSREQQTLMEMAESCPVLIAALKAGASDEDMRAACQIAATALAHANHLSPEVIEKQGILDESLILGTLMGMSCYGVASHGDAR